MQKPLLSIIIAANLLLVVACQPRSAVETSPEIVNTQSVDQDNAAQKPLVVSKVKVADNLVDAQTCLDINKNMQKVDDTSKIEAIYKVQEQLEACLPTANNKEVLTLIKSYQAMYGRFLAVDNYLDDEVFFDISESLDNQRKVSAKQLSNISSRNQYLVRLIEKDADVSLLYIGEGIFIFHHNFQQMADLFTPYLPKDQQTFIERMAMDNQDIFWNDAAIAVPFEEVISRAIFWENYIQQYPKSYFIKDAKVLFALYRHAIFFGSDNTQWTNDDINEFVSPEYEQAIKKLAEPSESVLTQDARTLLEFMAMSDAKRQQKYPVPEVDEDGYEIQDWATAQYQRKEALPIVSPWENDNIRDCLSRIICVDYNY